MSSVRFQEVKNNGNLRKELIIYERFQLQDFDYEKFGILNKWSLTRGYRIWKVYCVFCIYGVGNHHLIKDMRN